MKILICRVFLILCFFQGFFYKKAQAYHYFMAMGYSSCMTCHFSPGGGGPLNDYGRALFATELSSRWWASKKVTDDKLGEWSRFLGVKDLPFWVRPHVKLRTLDMLTHPGSQDQNSRQIPMQKELGTALVLDQDYKNVLVATLTSHDEKTRYSTSYQSNFQPSTYLKEMYLRKEISPDQWLVLGQQDKPFGIREVNHTSYSRRWTKLTQYDQSFGALYFKNTEKWEASLMGYWGNLNEDEPQRAKGFSVLFDKAFSETSRLGTSFLTQKNDKSEVFAVSGQYRKNFDYLAAFAGEVGLVSQSVYSSQSQNISFYLLSQYFFRLVRGVNFLFEYEVGRYDITQGNPILQRSGLGFLLFPLPRSELKVHLYNEKNIKPEVGSKDVWQLQTQWHLSL